VYFKKILLYGAETGHELLAVEIKFLRKIVGKTRRERIRNTHIRAELKMEEIHNQIEK
jgi:hypothetical protein